MTFRASTQPQLTTHVSIPVPELTDAELVYVIVSLVGTLFQDFPEGSPVLVDAVHVPVPAPGEAGPIVLGATMLPGSQMRVLIRGPSPGQTIEPRVTMLSTILIS